MAPSEGKESLCPECGHPVAGLDNYCEVCWETEEILEALRRVGRPTALLVSLRQRLLFAYLKKKGHCPLPGIGTNPNDSL